MATRTKRETDKAMAKRIAADLQRDFGLTAEQAAGVVGNLAHESENFKTMQERGQKKGKGGYGWAQWTGSRRKSFENFAESKGLSKDSYAANYGFLKEELQTTERRALKAVKNAKTVKQASRAFEDKFERAGVVKQSSRDAYAASAFSGIMTPDNPSKPVSRPEAAINANISKSDAEVVDTFADWPKGASKAGDVDTPGSRGYTPLPALKPTGRRRNMPTTPVIQDADILAKTMYGPDYGFTAFAGQEPPSSMLAGSRLNHPKGDAADGYLTYRGEPVKDREMAKEFLQGVVAANKDASIGFDDNYMTQPGYPEAANMHVQVNRGLAWGDKGKSANLNKDLRAKINESRGTGVLPRNAMLAAKFTPTFRPGLLNDEDRQTIGLPPVQQASLTPFDGGQAATGREATLPTFRPQAQSESDRLFAEIEADRQSMREDFRRSQERTRRAVERGSLQRNYAPTMQPHQDFPVNPYGNHAFGGDGVSLYDETNDGLNFVDASPAPAAAPVQAINTNFEPRTRGLSDDDVKRTLRQGRYDIGQFGITSPAESRRMNAEGYAKDVYQEDRQSGLLSAEERSQFGLPTRAAGVADDNPPPGAGIIPRNPTKPTFRPSRPERPQTKAAGFVEDWAPVGAGAASYRPETQIKGPLGKDVRTEAEKMGLYATPQAPFVANPLDRALGVDPNASTARRSFSGAKRGLAIGALAGGPLGAGVGAGVGALLGARRNNLLRNAADRMQWGQSPVSGLFGGNQAPATPPRNVGSAMNVYNSGGSDPVYGTANSGATVTKNVHGNGWTSVKNNKGVETATIPLAGGGTTQAVVNGGGLLGGLFGGFFG